MHSCIPIIFLCFISFSQKSGSQLQGTSKGRRGGEYKGGGGYRGGGRFRKCSGPSRCYNCDEVGHLGTDFPPPKRPWWSNFQVNNHMIKGWPRLIVKCEDKTRQRIINLVNSQPRSKGELFGPMISDVTNRGTCTNLIPLKGISLRFRKQDLDHPS